MTKIETLDFQDILLRPATISSLPSRRDAVIVNGSGFVPISAANMNGVGTFTMAKNLSKRKWLTYIHKSYTLDRWKDFISDADLYVLKYTVPTIGSGLKDLTYLKSIMQMHEFERVCIDVANGHSLSNMEQIGFVRRAFPNVQIVYGNVANNEILNHMRTNDLIPDFIKIGIGSGSVCTTRLKTGVGVPQASLIEEFVRYRDCTHSKFKIISDGGCRNPGDVVKALALGADEVMLGGMLAYSDASECVDEDGCVEFFGSSNTSSPLYDDTKGYVTSEGLHTYEPAVLLDSLVSDIEGGLRSAMTYLDCRTIGDLQNIRKDNSIGDPFLVVRRQTDNYT